MSGKKRPNRLPINESDRTDPGPTKREDGSRYKQPRIGQTDEEYRTMLRRMPPEAFGGLRGDGGLGSPMYLTIDLTKKGGK